MSRAILEFYLALIAGFTFSISRVTYSPNWCSYVLLFVSNIGAAMQAQHWCTNIGIGGWHV